MMTHEKTEALAFELMNSHGLITKGWKFDFDNARRRLGYCSHRRRKISLSKNYVPKLGHEEIKDVVLHEIAHALVGTGHGHNSVWRAKAVEIGCNGKRLYDGEVRIKPKFKGTCPACGRVIQKHRRNRTSCGKCGDHKFNEKYLFVWTLNN